MIHKDGFFIKKFPITQDESKNVSIVENGQIDFSMLAAQENDLDYETVSIVGKEIIDISDNFSLEFKNSGVMINGIIYTEQVEADYHGNRVLLGDILEKDVDEKYYIDGEEKLEKWKYLKGAKKIPRTSKSGHEYIFSEGPLAFPDPLDRPARTMLTSESSVNRSSHVVEDPATKRLRIITPVEAERINGFDDNWTNTGMTEKFRYFCMGNALVVGLVAEMGDIIKDVVNNEK